MRKSVFTFFVTLVFSISTFSQTHSISGTIVDQNGDLVPFATVNVKGTKNSVAANERAGFVINAKAGDILVITAVGVDRKEVPIGNKDVISVVVNRSGQNLNEVVVTALGIKRSEKSVGYAVSKVDPNAVVQKSEPDVLKSLQGKVPGVDIRVGQGAPGAATRIQIRGISSIGLQTQPLFVVDGVPYSNNEINAGDAFAGGGAAGTGFANLDVNDIASINILKGAAAASLYGSRAANGVVLITTKSGTATKGPKPLNVNYKTSYSMEKIGRLPEFQNSYGAGANFKEQGSNGSWGAKFGQGVIYNTSGLPAGTSSSGVDSIPATTWSAMYNAYPELFPNGLIAYKAVPDNVSKLFNTGHLYENSINFNGGNENTTFDATLSNLVQKGYITNSSYVKNNIAMGGQTRLGGLTIGASVSYAHTKQVGGYFGQVQSFLTQWGRTFTQARNWDIAGYPTTDKNGNQIGFNTGQYTNPIWAAYHNTITTYDDRSVGNFHASYRANSLLTFNYVFGVNNYALTRDAIVDESSYGSTDNAVGNITETVYKDQELQSTLIAVITPKINNDFTLDIKLGNDINQRTSRYQQVYGSDFIVSGLYNLTNTNTKTFNSDTRNKRRLVGFFGDATLGYKNFAFINVSGREDLTSTLPYKNAQYFYYGTSASFVWSDAFKLRSNWLDYGKLRIGYAKVGNDADPQNGQDVFSLYTTSFLGQPRAARSTVTYDPDLTPEFTHELETGMDFQFFHDRIHAEITWYDKKTTNLIYNVDVPSTTGYTSFYTNIGEIENKGWEIGLSVKPIASKTVLWQVRAAYTRNRNTVNKLVEGLQRIPIGGYTDAVGEYLEPGFAYGYFRGTVAARYEGELLVDPNTGWALEDPNSTYLGDPNPNYKLGITNSITVKGFTLSALFDMTVGGSFYSESINSMLGRGVTLDTKDRETNRVINGYYGNTTPVLGDDGENHFVPLLIDGKPITNQTKITTNDLYFQGGIANVTSFATNSSGEFSLYGATVYHLREITLGYDLPHSIVSRLKFSNINISVSGHNLWFLAPDVPKYTHYDPELSSFGTSTAQGFDISGAPAPKRYGVNLNVTF